MAQARAEINQDVLQWAIDESGLSVNEFAARVKRPVSDVEAWLTGELKPTLPQLRLIAEQLRRPSAIFYLQAPPARSGVPPSLRAAPGLGDHMLDPEEIKRIRWISRLQRTLAWLAEDADARPIALPELGLDDSPEAAGVSARRWLGISVRQQLGFADARQAFDGWRTALEQKGILVPQFQIDRRAIRGFSITDDRVPIVAVNTAYTPQARTFTLLHELGHLVRRDGSACIGFAGPDDPRQVERWCEQFAAAVLLPARATSEAAEGLNFRGEDDEAVYRAVRRVARTFKASVRATAIRLAELGLADASTYRAVDRYADAAFDDFPKPSGGGGGQTAAEKRLSQLGVRAVERLLAAADDGAITSRDVGDYLHLSPSQVSDLISLVGQ